MINVTDDTFEVGSEPTVLYFWVPWAAPCKVVNVILKKLDDGRCRFCAVCADTELSITARYRIISAPYLIFLKGDYVSSLCGNHSEGKIKERIDRLLEV